jgi:chromosome segregation and condensation protein ScpB
MERGLVRLAGRDGSPDRPVLHGTTRKFVQVFGLHIPRPVLAAEAVRRQGGE